MEYFEQYVQQLTQSFEEINYVNFLLNLVITAVLAFLLSVFYVRLGNSANNRKKFGRIFVPLAMTTMLIIFIVKSSVALSLGLVGALSIVRFRAAIKEPEELTYLFLTIGLGLAAGADEIIIAVVAFAFITAILFVQNLIAGKRSVGGSDNMVLNISTSLKDLAGISELLSVHFSFVDLRRLDIGEGRTEASFSVAVNKVEDIITVREELLKADPNMLISFVEQRNLAI